jgi:hypothetical protein
MLDWTQIATNARIGVARYVEPVLSGASRQPQPGAARKPVTEHHERFSIDRPGVTLVAGCASVDMDETLPPTTQRKRLHSGPSSG